MAESQYKNANSVNFVATQVTFPQADFVLLPYRPTRRSLVIGIQPTTMSGNNSVLVGFDTGANTRLLGTKIIAGTGTNEFLGVTNLVSIDDCPSEIKVNIPAGFDSCGVFAIETY